MKNLKRFMAGALALIMVMGMTLTVSATETNSVPSIEGRYVVKELDEKALEGVPAADRNAIEAVSKGDATDTFSSAIVDAGTSGAQSVSDALAGKEWLTPFFEVRTEPEGQTTVPDHNFDLRPWYRVPLRCDYRCYIIIKPGGEGKVVDSLDIM